MMISNMMDKAAAPIERPAPYANLIVCHSAQTQFSDCFSRLGISTPSNPTGLGLGRAHLASQREGKTFLEPLLQVQVEDEEAGQRLFAGAAAARRPTLTWYPWGCCQEQEEQGVRVRVTAAFAETDILVVRITLRNESDRMRCFHLEAGTEAVAQDSNLMVRVLEPSDLSILAQTSKPTSSMQIRREPDFRILTGFRWLFSAQAVPGARGIRWITPTMKVSPDQERSFDLVISAAAFDLSPQDAQNRISEERMVALLTSRLWSREFLDVPAAIRQARERSEDRLKKLPLDGVEPEFQPLVQQAAVILLKNSIRPSPEQSYGSEMGGHIGTFPVRDGYEGFWIWDSAKQAWGLRYIDPFLAQENIRLMLHHQREDGGLFMIHPDSKGPSTQPPLFSHAVMRMYAAGSRQKEPADQAFLESVYPPLVRWNQWWFSHGDPDGNGLAAWPDNLTSGWDDSPRWDTDIPAGWRQNSGAAQYEAVDLNSFLVVDLLSLAQMAELLRKPEEATRFREQANDLRKRILEGLYCKEDNLFYDRKRNGGEWNRIKTPACFMPLWAGVPLAPAKIRAMLQDVLLSEQHFFGDYPFPVVAYSEPRCDPGGGSGYWRGPVWLDQDWFMLSILEAHKDLLDEPHRQKIEVGRRRILNMVMQNGMHENYNSRTGRAGDLSREHFSWTAACVMAIARRDY